VRFKPSIKLDGGIYGSKTQGLKTKTALKPTGFRRKEKSSAPSQPKSVLTTSRNSLQSETALQKRTLKHIAKTRALALESTTGLTEWEDEFLESVSSRIKTYGRAFRDPELGQIHGTLSLRQGLKVKQIAKKAKSHLTRDKHKSADRD